MKPELGEKNSNAIARRSSTRFSCIGDSMKVKAITCVEGVPYPTGMLQKIIRANAETQLEYSKNDGTVTVNGRVKTMIIPLNNIRFIESFDVAKLVSTAKPE